MKSERVRGHVRISLRKARKLVTEEANTAKEYRAYGFKAQAKQEAQHAKFFRKIVKKKLRGA